MFQIITVYLWFLPFNFITNIVVVFLSPKIDKQTEDLNFEIVYNITCMFAGIMFAFLLCYFATHSSDNLTAIADFIHYNTDWYTYNNSIAKYSILIMARAQCIPYFIGIKLILCTLQNFTKVPYHEEYSLIIHSKTIVLIAFEHCLPIRLHPIVSWFGICRYAKLNDVHKFFRISNNRLLIDTKNF